MTDRSSAAGVAAALAAVPRGVRKPSGPFVGLSDLPLPDHLLGARGGAGQARDDYRAGVESAATIDVAAQREAELLEARQAGYEAGLAAGLLEGERDGLELLRGIPGLLGTAIADTNASVDEAVSVLASDMVAAAMEIASWALAREIALDDEALLDVAASALREAGGLEGAQVAVSPALGRVAAVWSQRLGLERPDVVEDPTLPAGTVTVRSVSGGKAAVSLPLLVARACESLGLEPIGLDQVREDGSE